MLCSSNCGYSIEASFIIVLNSSRLNCPLPSASALSKSSLTLSTAFFCMINLTWWLYYYKQCLKSSSIAFSTFLSDQGFCLVCHAYTKQPDEVTITWERLVVREKLQGQRDDNLHAELSIRDNLLYKRRFEETKLLLPSRVHCVACWKIWHWKQTRAWHAAIWTVIQLQANRVEDRTLYKNDYLLNGSCVSYCIYRALRALDSQKLICHTRPEMLLARQLLLHFVRKSFTIGIEE